MKITSTFFAILATLIFLALPTVSASVSGGNSGPAGTPPPAPAAQPKGHKWTSGSVDAGTTSTCPDAGGTTITKEDVEGPDGSTTWKYCSGDDDHAGHLEITTSKSTNHIIGHGYTLFMKSKSNNTATGNNTTVHHKSGSSDSTFAGTGNNNQGWLHGTSNTITWSGNNNNTGNNP